MALRSRGSVSLVALGAALFAALLVLALLGWLGPAAQPDPDIAAAPPGLPAKAVAGRGARPDAGPGVKRNGVPHTRLPLRLVATVVRTNRELSLATLEDLEHGGHVVMNEGQSFRDHSQARIASVERGRVLIDNAGVREQLMIDRSLRPASPLAASPEEVERRRDMSRRLRELTDAGERFRELRPTRRGGLLNEGEVSPVYEDGELIGVQLADLREGGVYQQAGLRDGDVVTSVNGVSLGEPTAAAEVLAKLALSDQLTVAVERADGTEELLSVSTAEFTDALQQLE